MRIFVRYDRPDAFFSDFEQQIARGGLLVKGRHEVTLHAEVDVVLQVSGDEAVAHARVVQTFPGVGVAVLFEGPAMDVLKRFASKLSGGAPVSPPSRGGVRPNAPTANTSPALPEADGELASEATDVVEEEESEEEARAGAQPPANADRIHKALYGNRDERAAILRDAGAKQYHSFVLRNPGLSTDEIMGLAKASTTGADILKAIADKREWAGRSDLALALVRNPKTPIPVALKVLSTVTPADLRQLAKDQHTRAPIQQAARKLVLK